VPFVWVTNVGVGASIDAADRNETKTNISALYVALGANWPGNVRFPVCGGAGFDMVGPCPVVWDIAVGDSIYQTPAAHPISELQEARDKLDWIWDNKCAAENAVHDNPVNAAANPNTQAAANPITQALENPVTQAAANPTTQAAENPVTQAAANPTTQAAANPTTQAAENPVTNVSNDPGCGTDCPSDNPAANLATETGEDTGAMGIYNQDLAVHKSFDEDANQGGYCAPDWGTVQASYCSSNQVIVDLFVDVTNMDIVHENHCTAEFGGVFYRVYYDELP